jgi:mono/diheme cytochrome c family protein
VRLRRRNALELLAASALAAVIVAALVVFDPDAHEEVSATPALRADARTIEQGRYLALAGNCAGCHTQRGAAAYAGGAGIATPFGTVFAGNLTPDAETGIGAWSADDFWRAMHLGRSRDGRRLYPAFPYTSFTHLTRRDTDALFAYLQSLPPVSQANRPHQLRFPFNTQAALAVWQALYLRPGGIATDTTKSAQWQRGAYLVRGLGHCSACHAPRGWLGAVADGPELQGGLMSEEHWHAVPLAPYPGMATSRLRDEWMALLKNGVSDRRTLSGPMADVVFWSTQHLSDADLHAMALFLSELPPLRGDVRAAPRPVDAAQFESGRGLYQDHCASCHGKQGEGEPGAYAAMAGNETVTMDPPANVVRIVLEGGFLPATAGNPRNYGMPPFAQLLSNAQIADLLSYLRNAWGNRAAPLSVLDVERYR